jgi:L-rhamnose-H+ transport protein
MHLTGLLLIVVGGLMEGLFALPMRFAPRWAWENFWGAGSLMALVLVPWPLAFLTVPHLGNVYASADSLSLVLAVVFGAGWGCGGIFFGLGVAYLGLSLGTSIIMGLIAIGGSIVPLLLARGTQISVQGGIGLLAGITLMVIGLTMCARAGNLKHSDPGEQAQPRKFGVGLMYCLAAGVLSALVNFALVFGAPIAQPAIASGVDPATATNAVWAIVFTVNFLVNIGYCLFRAARNGSLQRFRRDLTPPHYWLLALLMGMLWAGGIVAYGRGASLEGPLGPVFGFPIMLITSILTGNAAGALCGEWRNQPPAAKNAMRWGISVMVLAVVTLGYVNYHIH